MTKQQESQLRDRILLNGRAYADSYIEDGSGRTFNEALRLSIHNKVFGNNELMWDMDFIQDKKQIWNLQDSISTKFVGTSEPWETKTMSDRSLLSNVKRVVNAYVIQDAQKKAESWYYKK